MADAGDLKSFSFGSPGSTPGGATAPTSLQKFLSSIPRSVLFIAVLLSAATLWIALSLPRYATLEGEPVSLVSQRGPLYTAIVTSRGTLPLSALSSIEEPDILESWTDWAHFTREQSAILQATRGEEELRLLRADGSHELVKRAPTSLRQLPWAFWLQLLTAAFCCIAAELAVRFAPRTIPLLGYRIAGWGVAFSAWTSAIYTTRSLAIPVSVFESAHFINAILGGPLFGAGTTILLATHPKRLFRAWPLLSLGPIFLLFPWLWRSEFIGPAASLYGVIGVYSVAIPILLILQRFACKNDPVGHAIWRWQALAVLAGIGFFVSAQAIPTLLAIPPWASQATTLLGFAVMFLLMSLGATRYRLFSVSYYWGRAWLWIFAGALILALDLLLASFLPLNGGLTPLLSLLIIGWLYFPLRQWLLLRLTEPAQNSLASDVATLARASNSAEHLLYFEQVLHSRFRPAKLTIEKSTSPVHLADNGQSLIVPWPTGENDYRIELKNGGTTLFDEKDENEARALVEVARGLLEGLAAYRKGERSERERVRRDLHDHLGARLSRLSSGAQNTELEGDVKHLIEDLRHVSSVLLEENIQARDVLLELEAEARALSRSFSLQLELRVRGEGGLSTYISASQRADFLAALREGLNNAARHGVRQAPVLLELITTGEELKLRIENARESSDKTDGAPAPESLSLGLGLTHLERRAQLRGGSFRFSREETRFTMEFVLPLTPRAETLSRGGAAVASPQSSDDRALGSTTAHLEHPDRRG